MDKVFEDAAAVFVILKLIEAGTSWGKQDNITGTRGLRSGFHSALDGAGAFDGHASGDLRFDLVRGGANQERENRFLAQRVLQHGVITTFVFATKKDQDSAWKSVQGFQRGIHVGGFRIVEVCLLYTSDAADE